MWEIKPRGRARESGSGVRFSWRPSSRATWIILGTEQHHFGNGTAVEAFRWSVPQLSRMPRCGRFVCASAPCASPPRPSATCLLACTPGPDSLVIACPLSRDNTCMVLDQSDNNRTPAGARVTRDVHRMTLDTLHDARGYGCVGRQCYDTSTDTAHTH